MSEKTRRILVISPNDECLVLLMQYILQREIDKRGFNTDGLVKVESAVVARGPAGEIDEWVVDILHRHYKYEVEEIDTVCRALSDVPNLPQVWLNVCLDPNKHDRRELTRAAGGPGAISHATFITPFEDDENEEGIVDPRGAPEQEQKQAYEKCWRKANRFAAWFVDTYFVRPSRTRRPL
ncbi:MAG: hypothetical protein WDZ79_01735 [Candidatus Paceibacterota bacterium]